MTEYPQQGSKSQMNSRFQLVIAAAKRSKQISAEAKTRGLSPNQVALVRSKFTKPVTLALEELKAGKVRYVWNKDEPAEARGGGDGVSLPPYQEKTSPVDEAIEPLRSEKMEITESKC